jgi:hypothetical protein
VVQKVIYLPGEVVLAYPRYSGDRDQEDQNLKQTQAKKITKTPISTNTPGMMMFVIPTMQEA